MKYIFNEDFDLPIKERILKINNTTINELDVNTLKCNYDIEPLINFKNNLLSYKDKRFFIVGDYDCDGICATTIMVKLFKELSIEANYYIPSRTKDGYGINSDIVLTAHNNKFDCLLCVDNGVAATEQIKLANDLGLKVFIIDHHEYSNIPDYVTFLHPNILPKDYEDMCAGGLCSLLANSFGENEFYFALGGLATLADMVSIFGYNRFLVTKMFEIVRKGYIRPISLLLGDCEVTYSNIQFNVIPKINAVSRLDDIMNVNYVVKYLLSKDRECLAYFDKIENINSARKEYSKEMYSLATRLIKNEDKIIVIRSEEFKEGLCGLLANKILDNFSKPAIVFSQDGEMFKGSGRCVPGTNFYEYLANTKDLFETFGGHELAVGLSIKEENFDNFIEYINTHELTYSEQYKDVLVINQDEINDNLLMEIDSLQPYGTNFKEPLIAIKDVKYKSKFLVGRKYPKFEINDYLSAIAFKTNLITDNFEYMIGHIQNDNYYQNKLSFVIEDLV